MTSKCVLITELRQPTAVRGVYGKHLWEVKFKEYTADQSIVSPRVVRGY